MANFATLVFLFCLIAVVAARSSPETDAFTTAISMPITEANTELPIKPVAESDPNAAAMSTPITEVKLEFPDVPIQLVSDKSDSNTVLLTARPLNRAPFRPVNRRFPVRQRFPCHHHFKIDQIKKDNEERSYGNDMLVSTREVPFGDDTLIAPGEVLLGKDALVAPSEVPYGNDMILPAGENIDFEKPVPRGEMRIIPGRWVRLHHHHHHHDDDSDSDSDDDEENDWMKKTVFNKRYHHGRLDREKKLKILMIMRNQFRDRVEVEERRTVVSWAACVNS